MALGLINDSTLTAIADAIREKNGSSSTYAPAEMAQAISAISGAAIDIDWENDRIITADTTLSSLALPSGYSFDDIKLAIMPVGQYLHWLILAPGTLTPEMIESTSEDTTYKYFFPAITLGRNYNTTQAGIALWTPNYYNTWCYDASYPTYYSGVVSSDLSVIDYVENVGPTDPQTAFTKTASNYVVANNHGTALFVFKPKEEA